MLQIASITTNNYVDAADNFRPNSACFLALCIRFDDFTPCTCTENWSMCTPLCAFSIYVLPLTETLVAKCSPFCSAKRALHKMWAANERVARHHWWWIELITRSRITRVAPAKLIFRNRWNLHQREASLVVLGKLLSQHPVNN
jgi:hypothetical protein